VAVATLLKIGSVPCIFGR